jgi:hypothetical protein
MKGDITQQDIIIIYNASLTGDILYTFDDKLQPKVLYLKGQCHEMNNFLKALKKIESVLSV